MNVVCHYRRFGDADIGDGEIYAPMEVVDLRCLPSQLEYELYSLVPGMEPEGPMEWSSSSPQCEGDWLTLTGRIYICDRDYPALRYFEVSLHGSLAQLQRAHHWWTR